MKTYTEFHGSIPPSEIGKKLREIAKREAAFKIMTGYGSTTGKHSSKTAALKSLSAMRKEGLISAYISGEKVTELITNSADPNLAVRERYWSVLKNDPDRGNDGIIFVFVK